MNIKEANRMIEEITHVINNNELLDCEKVNKIKDILAKGEEKEETPEINCAVFPAPEVHIVDGFHVDVLTFDEIDDILSLLLNTDFDIEE